MTGLDRNRSAGYMTNLAARLFARAIDRQLKPLGLSSGQLPVFFALANGEALAQRDLARVASIEQPTMASTLARMERDGLIQRAPDPKDGRSALVSLTAKARAKVGPVMEAVAAGNAEALGGIEPADREAYLESLKSIVEALQRSLAPEESEARVLGGRFSSKP